MSTRPSLSLYDESQTTVKCVSLSADHTKQQLTSALGSEKLDSGGIKQRSFRLTRGPLGSGPILHVAGRSLLRSSRHAYRCADCPSVRLLRGLHASGTYRLPSPATGRASRSAFSLRNVSTDACSRAYCVFRLVAVHEKNHLDSARSPISG